MRLIRPARGAGIWFIVFIASMIRMVWPSVTASPMVGTAYLAPEPDAPAFAKVGDAVTEGQTILIIEAMKTMNQILSLIHI